MNSFRLILVFILTHSLSACAISGGPVSGKVLEEGTNKPIPGAIVVVSWIGPTTSGSIYVEARDVCYHAETATTDEQGRYQTKAWSQEQNKNFSVKFDHVQVTAYKVGYGDSQLVSQIEGIEYLALFKGSREERLGYLERMARSGGCDSAGQSRENLYPLYESLYNEAKVNAAKEEDLQWYRRAAAKISVGVSDERTHEENEKRIEQFLREHLK